MKGLKIFLASFLLVAALSGMDAAPGRYDIIPAPRSLTPAEGSFVINKSTRIKVEADDSLFNEVARDFADQIMLVSGYDLFGKSGNPAILLKEVAGLEDEEYRLRVDPISVLIEATTSAGAFYGMQTILQLLPSEAYGDKKAKGISWKIPCCSISDKPRFTYRGMMLDCARYFMPKETVKKFIDVMAMNKQNVFHWHLTDDQGWRIEIKKYPKLTEVGAWRPFTADYNGKNPDGTVHGGFYSQDDVREIVEYARHRHVTVVPEIELPGHGSAALAAYPQLSCDSTKKYEVATCWGVKTDIFCPNAFTFTFLQDVFTELFELFPSPYYHIGGDECPKDAWEQSKYCQDLITVLGIKDEHELQSFFVKRMDAFLREHGKTVIGWDEILDGSAVESTVAMSYRGHAPAVKAMKQGIKVILSPNRWCYLDYYQTDMEKEPKAQPLFLPVSKVYNYFPAVDSLPELSKKYIIGYECCLWGEYDQNPERMEYLAFPRGLAAGEVGWTDRPQKDWDSFRARMQKGLARLDAKLVRYCDSYYDVLADFDRKADFPKEVTLSVMCPDAVIRYTLDGSEPRRTSDLYEGVPIKVQKGTRLRARGFDTNGKPVGKLTDKEF